MPVPVLIISTPAMFFMPSASVTAPEAFSFSVEMRSTFITLSLWSLWNGVETMTSSISTAVSCISMFSVRLVSFEKLIFFETVAKPNEEKTTLYNPSGKLLRV